MSGGPPHHPHNRQVPAANLANAAWNHLQVPFFPRQPQLAHMSNEHSILHQPTWHTPTTTEAMKIHPHSHVLSEMFKNDTSFPRDCVDLSLTRNGNQNGEVAPIPISLSVRDTNKINSLPPSALEIQAVELIKSTSPNTKPASPGLVSASPNLRTATLGMKSSSPAPKSASPGLMSASPGLKSASPGLKSSSPGLMSASTGLKSASPVPKSASPGLISATSSLISTTTSGLTSVPSGMVPSITGMLPLSSNLISTSRSMLPASQGLALVSPALKASGPVPKSISPGLKPASPGIKPVVNQNLPYSTTVEVIKTQKRSNIRVDSILERLNPCLEKNVHVLEHKQEESISKLPVEKPEEKVEITEKPVSVIVQPTSSFDDNSNSSSILNVPTSTNIRDEDTVSSYSNEDSLDSNKSRRKRKPNKTIRVSKDEEKLDDTGTPVESIETISKELKQVEPEKDPISIVGEMLEEGKSPEKAESSHELEELIPATTRRKASSESETIDNIAAMVQEGLKEKKQQKQQIVEKPEEHEKLETQAKPISVSVIKTKEHLADVLADTASTITTTAIVTPAQKKATNTHFVEVENKLEEMFAGIEDFSDPIKTDPLDLDDSKLDDPLLKLDDSIPSTSQKSETAVTSTTEAKKKSPLPKKTKRKATTTPRWSSDAASFESAPKKKKLGKKVKAKSKASSKKPVKQQKQGNTKPEPAKDVYAYDSGSNTSSTKSKGPFIQIRGNRDSPLSVNVVNTINEEDGERRLPKAKKFHDDVEYRHKVRSKGLHCSTLSNKYDAQTKDVSWICAFCKRGPHASELSGPTSNRDVIPPGDLFGPYFITTQCPEFERRLDDPYDKQFKSKKISRALEESAAKGFGKKSKRKHSDIDGLSESESDIYLGITETGNKNYEVWAHEDCIVWSPGIYLIGPKIAGLEEAVWTSCNVACRSCNLKGANISCLRRGCLNVMHLCCARSNDWEFVESEFKAYCPEHRVP
ncbi:uncharacterized protein isoform X1 [Leptinotarsa decemlineata]|uniref:uncharacterized protein isoform X1 n=2 Tax=Leptinotarsa decemlineata TaxID=7539 RepID=UPI003D303E68